MSKYNDVLQGEENVFRSEGFIIVIRQRFQKLQNTPRRNLFHPPPFTLPATADPGGLAAAALYLGRPLTGPAAADKIGLDRQWPDLTPGFPVSGKYG